MVVYEVRVSLLGAEPPVWRRVRMPKSMTLPLLHRVLQLVMGWDNSHMHEFVSVDRKRYGAVDGSDSLPGVLDEEQYRLSELLREPGDTSLYIYDFGDDWAHELSLETVSELGEQDEPVWCLNGSGACPPEDCGGVPGYTVMLGALIDKSDEGHEDAVELLGEDFDAEGFDCSFFNERVKGKYPEGETPLIPEEVAQYVGVLKELHGFLESDLMPESAMSILALDGFFSALAIHPITIMPNTWLPWVWDMSGEEMEPDFSSKQEVEKVMGLLFTYMNSVISKLTEEPEGYEPLFEELPIETIEEAMLAAEDWAIGFMVGAMIDKDVFTRTFEDESGRLFLSPFAVMSGMFNESEGGDQEQLSITKEQIVGEVGLGACVLNLREYWMESRQKFLSQQSGSRTVEAEVRIGRNVPCPCGSGKKYKQCCGK